MKVPGLAGTAISSALAIVARGMGLCPVVGALLGPDRPSGLIGGLGVKASSPGPQQMWHPANPLAYTTDVQQPCPFAPCIVQNPQILVEVNVLFLELINFLGANQFDCIHKGRR